MNVQFDQLLVNGKPFLPPDATIDFSYEDLDDEASGRDESGIMHRIVVRYKVMTGSFVFSNLTKEDYVYMEAIFPDPEEGDDENGEPEFEFTRPSRKNPDKLVTTTCYRSKYGISWVNARTGAYKNYKFNIIEC